MRLYAKLFVMIVLAGALQHLAPPSAWGRQAWFAARCQAAHLLGDERLAAELVEEIYHENRMIREEDVLECEHEFRRERDCAADEWFVATAEPSMAHGT